MTPGASQTSNDPRKQIGQAIWLLLLLLRFTPSEWTGQHSTWVAGGNVVSDAELAERLRVSGALIEAWRNKLRKLGLIGWLLSPGSGRAFWISPAFTQILDYTLGQSPAKDAAARSTSNDAKAAAPSARSAIWRAIQERSIALTGKVVEDLDAAEGLRLANTLADGSKNPCESAPSGS